jgi:hypothetical protein
MVVCFVDIGGNFDHHHLNPGVLVGAVLLFLVFCFVLNFVFLLPVSSEPK